eukprot:TRINITY_DN34929_c0_g1_i1.p1 TRINITY_DN34929_c0_g1~~TRINITY_DN34929_c0_g1_i1.p1  ORF type:complete len:142 (-),score=23.96 TRINITY_DN34929_c0_g1_i1:130-555(-)
MATSLVSAFRVDQSALGCVSSAAFAGSNQGLQAQHGAARVVCKKEGIHPKFFKEAKVVCNGEVVMTTMGTKDNYVVDVWSGNHPFFQGSKNTLISEAGRVDKFNQRYGALGTMSKIPILDKGEIVIVKKSKGDNKKGKGRR